MAIDTTKDPIHQVYEGIRDCLTNDAGFASLVDTDDDLIDYTSTKRTADKPGLQTADLPQVRIVLTGLNRAQIFRTSNSCSLETQWAIELKVGDKRLGQASPIIWAIYRAMSRWPTYLRDAVTWESQNPVKRLMPMKAEVRYAPTKKPPEPAGWVAVFAAQIDLFVSTTDLQAEGT